MIVVPIINSKGGIGKTSTAINLSACISKFHKKRVLLLDVDTQSSLTIGLNIDNKSFNLFGCLIGNYPAKPVRVDDRLDIIPGSHDIAAWEVLVAQEVGREYFLKDFIQQFENNYDLIIIDCPPTLNLITINSLAASPQTHVIIPIEAEYLSIVGLTQVIDLVVNKIKSRINPSISISGILITKYDRRKILHRDSAETIEDAFQKILYKTRIRTCIEIAESPSVGQDIFKYNPLSNGARDYSDFCEEFLERVYHVNPVNQ